MPHPDTGSDLQPEFDNPAPGVTRRTALKAAAIGVGYAAATLPVAANTVIHTSSEGLRAGPVKYTVDGFEVPAYAAAPARRTDLPVVLVVQEVFGVTDYIADVCRRLAKAGYFAIAPELYERQGDPQALPDISRLQTDIVSKVPDAEVIADLDGAIRYAAANGGDAGEAAITGFCWGGRIVWLYAATGRVRAGVAWYGRLAGQAGAHTPKHPVDVAANLHAPVLGLYGGKDPGIPLDTVDKMKAALASGSPAARASQFVVYPEAGHAFHADYRSSYVQEAAEDGWKRTLAWFRSNGVD